MESSTNSVDQKIKTMENQIRILKNKVQELSAENVALRDANMRFQIENFNLQEKIRKFEKAEEEVPENDRERSPVSEREDKQEESFENDSIIIQSEEYLDEYIESTEIDDNKLCSAAKGKLSEEVQIYIEPDAKKSLEDVQYEVMVVDDETDELESANDQGSTIKPKESMMKIYKLAASKGVLNKLKGIESGKQKDSAFVSKVLDLLFDKQILAESSAQGQKCQSKLHLPAKPALDQHKLDLCRKAFIYRLREEECSSQQKQIRLKSFLKLVNDKIQNSRKCMNRLESQKFFEV